MKYFAFFLCFLATSASSVVLTPSRCPAFFASSFKGLALTATVGSYGANTDQMRAVLKTIGASLKANDPRLKFSVRLNTSHVDVKDVLPTIERWYKLSHETGVPLTVIVDMPGPKMRIPKLRQEIAVRVGQTFDLVPVSTRTEVWENQTGQVPIPVSFFEYINELKIGEQLSFADGRVVAIKLGIGSKESVPFKIVELQAGVNKLTSRKGFNIPSVEFRNVVTEKDRQLIRLAYWSGRIPAVAASFVQSKGDLLEIRAEFARAKTLVDGVLAVDVRRTPLEPESYRFVNEVLARTAYSLLFPEKNTPTVGLDQIVKDLHSYFSRHRPIEPLIEAKLERAVAVENAGEISDHATILVSAQGDLGIEVTMAKLDSYTDKVVATAVKHGVPVKVATRLFMGLLTETGITDQERSRVRTLLVDGTSWLQVSDETTLDFDSPRGGPIPNYLAILGYLKGLNQGPTPLAPAVWTTVEIKPGETTRAIFLRIYAQSQASAGPLGVKVDHPVLARMLDYLPNVVVQGPGISPR